PRNHADCLGCLSAASWALGVGDLPGTRACPAETEEASTSVRLLPVPLLPE
ncbi:unnamed protein product, partial [Symbiodinium microadriaticum]